MHDRDGSDGCDGVSRDENPDESIFIRRIRITVSVNTA